MQTSIDKNLEIVQKRINNAKVTLIAVSKTRPISDIQLAYTSGQRNFGENYIQEAVTKITQAQELKLDIEWHFIGHLQSNKANLACANFNWIHSVDNIKLLTKLNAKAKALNKTLNILLQLKTSTETTKTGAAEEMIYELAKFAYDNCPHLVLRGLMVINEEDNLEEFKTANKVFQQLKELYTSVDTLSMGMSSSLEAAIAEGSNMVRIGTDIFGKRNYQ